MKTEDIPIEVVSLKTYSGNKSTITPADRTTIFGNPFPMRSEADRDAVCDEYHEYFIERMESDPGFALQVDRLAEKAQTEGYLRLGCHCAPKRCHGNTIAAYVRNLLNKRQA